MGRSQALFQHWYRNREFYRYLQKLAEGLRGMPSVPRGPAPHYLPHAAEPPAGANSPKGFVTDADLFQRSTSYRRNKRVGCKEGPSLLHIRGPQLCLQTSSIIENLKTNATLKQERIYAQDLQRSLDCLPDQA